MRYRHIAPGLEVSEVGFGNWTVTTGWWGDYSREEAVRLHREAFDHGITFFDTADAYAEGYGEEVLGEALAGVRDDVVIGTKFGYDISDEATVARRGQQERSKDFGLGNVKEALEGSLRRLGVDCIDLWQLHNPRMAHLDDDDLFEYLEEAREAGKIRHYGVALGPKIGWLDEGVHAMRTREVAAVQMIYNLLEQDPGRDLLAVARETDTMMAVRVPHSSGMLEGNLTEDTVFPQGDHRRHRPRSWLVEGVRKIATLDFLTEERTLGQAALRWILADPNVATTLPNIYSIDQIEEFAGAADVPDLAQWELARIQALYAENFGVEPGGEAVAANEHGAPGAVEGDRTNREHADAPLSQALEG
ncbi:aldo/keto reductase [Egibacter rhizosphaerae]|uniref:Aldo/keto reductase n=1 Tax=Egibacter rhizosphaerae TaxID=1670831 RepID=A0A411YGK2_9ACTN|nr:aldo/keto reductase [Egibacter rhizosphaerae]QBI20333.1 aldo/keto reductase [Egibacter rhizosphaerae]